MRIDVDGLMEASNHPGVVVLKFDAPWCEWCIKTQPDYDQAVVELGGRVTFLEYDVDQNRQIAKTFYALEEIPTLLFFKDGREVDRWTSDQITYDRLTERLGSL